MSFTLPLDVNGFPPQHPGYVDARYYTSEAMVGAGTAVAPSVNLLYAIPIYIAVTTRITKVGLNTVAAATVGGATARLGIFNNNYGTRVPSTLLIDAGAVDTTVAPGEIEATISQTVGPGWYWLAVMFSSITSLTITMHASSGFSTGLHGATTGAGGVSVIRVAQAYGAMPSVFPTVVSTDFIATSAPRLWWRKGV